MSGLFITIRESDSVNSMSICLNPFSTEHSVDKVNFILTVKVCGERQKLHKENLETKDLPFSKKLIARDL